MKLNNLFLQGLQYLRYHITDIMFFFRCNKFPSTTESSSIARPLLMAGLANGCTASFFPTVFR